MNLGMALIATAAATATAACAGVRWRSHPASQPGFEDDALEVSSSTQPVRAVAREAAIPKSERAAIVDFLEYDARAQDRRTPRFRAAAGS
jgi:hypothetical protein